MDNGGLEALLYELLKEDISDFNPRKLPLNREAFDVKMQSTSTAEQYIYTVLKEESVDIDNETLAASWPDDNKIRVNLVYKNYCSWCQSQNLSPMKNTR